MKYINLGLELREDVDLALSKDVYNLKQYVKQYAKYLGLDPEKIIDEFTYTLQKPILWNAEKPYLYTIELERNGIVTVRLSNFNSKYVRVFDNNKNEVPAQIISKKNGPSFRTFWKPQMPCWLQVVIYM